MVDSPRHRFYGSFETVIFYGFVIPHEQRDDSFPHYLGVDSAAERTANGLASLYVLNTLRKTRRMPVAAFRLSNACREHPDDAVHWKQLRNPSAW